MSETNAEDRPSPGGHMLMYRDGATHVQVRLDGQTAWLTQAAMAELFQTTPQNITIHIGDIYAEGELSERATCKDYLQVRLEGNRQIQRSLKHYSLEVILAVGYRVRSGRGTQFRQWATGRLSELLVKGFTLDADRIKAGQTIGADHFDELLAQIRDIRASERLFYQKITDIYATSEDYDSSAEATQSFFRKVQNKMHWAAHRHTAAEVVALRADAAKPHMGLTSWKNAPSGPVRRTDVGIAKNYLSKKEVEALNLIVSAYLDFAELQARKRRLMYMADWIGKLDDFLRLSEQDILTHAGKISHEAAVDRAQEQFAQYEQKRLQWEAQQPTSDFDRLVDESTQAQKKLPPQKRPRKNDDCGHD